VVFWWGVGFLGLSWGGVWGGGVCLGGGGGGCGCGGFGWGGGGACSSGGGVSFWVAVGVGRGWGGVDHNTPNTPPPPGFFGGGGGGGGVFIKKKNTTTPHTTKTNTPHPNPTPKPFLFFFLFFSCFRMRIHASHVASLMSDTRGFGFFLFLIRDGFRPTCSRDHRPPAEQRCMPAGRFFFPSLAWPVPHATFFFGPQAE